MKCDTIGHLIFATENRLPPEHPQPKPVENCYTELDCSRRTQQKSR